MLNYPGDFDFAYQGYQYPLPPSWKYAIRLEDQIQWLLQALLKINDEAVSQSILDAGLADNLEQAKEYADALYNVLKNQIAENYEELDERITNIYAGISMWLSPVVDGNKQYAPYINKQLFNAARPYAATYEEFKAKYGEMTYSQVTTALHEWTLYQLAFYSAVLLDLVDFGNFEQVLARCKPYAIDVTMYVPSTPKVIHTWGELKKYGALAYIEEE
jgi:hypothetical protein